MVDEASQIEVGDYVTVFSEFHHTLCKAIFIGDDKQCMFLPISSCVVFIVTA